MVTRIVSEDYPVHTKEDFSPFENAEEKERHFQIMNEMAIEREWKLMLELEPIPVRPGVGPPHG